MKISWEELNKAAMQIILNAGDARTFIMKAVDCICTDENIDEAHVYLDKAKILLEKAHKVQTEYIQNTVQDEEQKSCLLFAHAQDTLMVIHSERLMVINMLKIYNKLKGMIKE